jgi:hypothetical protein
MDPRAGLDTVVKNDLVAPAGNPTCMSFSPLPFAIQIVLSRAGIRVGYHMVDKTDVAIHCLQ